MVSDPLLRVRKNMTGLLSVLLKKSTSAAHAFRLNGDIFADLQLAVGARPQPAA